MLVKIYSENPNQRQINEVVNCLRNGGIAIIPTDTIYALACSLDNVKSIERLAQIKGIRLEDADFSLLCSDLKHISNYTAQLSNNTFKLMKRLLPGAFTFILEANNQIPKYFKRNKKTIGIRVPNNKIALEIIRLVESPLVVTSIKDEDEIIEYTTDPELIYERYQKKIDIMVDGGYGENEASTIIDCTQDEPEIIRQGKGIID